MPTQFGIDTVTSFSDVDSSSVANLDFVLSLTNVSNDTPLTDSRFIGAILFIEAQNNQEGNWVIGTLVAVNNADPLNPVITVDPILHSDEATQTDAWYITVMGAPSRTQFFRASLTAGVGYRVYSDFFFSSPNYSMFKNRNSWAKGTNQGGTVRVNLTGTISINQDSNTITGVGTLFLTQLSVGSTITTAGGYTYSIAGLVDNLNVIIDQTGRVTESGVAAFRGVDLFSDFDPLLGFSVAENANLYLLLIQEDATGDLDICFSSGIFTSIPPTNLANFDVPSGWTALGIIATMTASTSHVTEDINFEYGGGFLQFLHPVATNVYYDNDTSGLTATNVGAAIDELKTLIPAASTGPTLIQSGNVVAASTNLDFLSSAASSAWSNFSKIVIELVDITVSTNNVSLQGRVSTDNGATWDSAGGSYKYTGVATSDNDTATQINSTGATSIVMTRAFTNATEQIGNVASEGFSATIELFDPANAAIKARIRYAIDWYAGTDDIAVSRGAGLRVVAQDTDGFRFFLSAGTFSAGKYRVWGYP